FDPFPFPDCPNALREEIRAVAEELDAHRKVRQAEHPSLTLTRMYNVLEKLRADKPLDADDVRIKDRGLVLTLEELHDKLDSLVLRAYGWTGRPTDEQILERLVQTNAARAAEEKTGNVRWLRPVFQIPRFGSEAERARLEEERRRAAAERHAVAAQGALAFQDDLQEMKPLFPTGNELAETAAVLRHLAAAQAPMTIEHLCRCFKQGKQVEKRIAFTILALARLGHLASPDGGNAFTLRGLA
ncbi:MAG: class I SAM-dependent DNA methyltransferase, partial [Hyphomicrobiaceae bacterium]